MATTCLEERRGRLARDDAMPATLAETLLEVWEEGRDASPGERGLILLRAAAPALPDEDRASLTVGRRDAILLDLFERLFGDTATALAGCPNCGEQLEFDVPLAEIRIPAPDDRPARFTLTWAGREIAYRLPRTQDLATLGAESWNHTVGAEPRNHSVDAAARSLAERCILSIHDADGTPRDLSLAGEAAAALDAAIAAAVADADPQAVVTLTFDCPSCALHWQSPFDIVEFLWRRLDVSVRGLLREVHVLASHYGWSEREIVSLAPRRRRHYLELIGT
jgi:hypothetical protein